LAGVSLHEVEGGAVVDAESVREVGDEGVWGVARVLKAQYSADALLDVAVAEADDEGLDGQAETKTFLTVIPSQASFHGVSPVRAASDRSCTFDGEMPPRRTDNRPRQLPVRYKDFFEVDFRSHVFMDDAFARP
jgi:hypothetical protein